MSTTINGTTRKTIVFLIAIMMLAMVFSGAAFTDTGKAYAVGETGQTTASKLYVRSGAGTNYSKLGSLARGSTFVVTGSAKDKSGVTWYKLKYKSKNGYVSSKYVNIKQPSVTALSNMTGTVTTKSGPLTIRSGPGTGYGKLGTLAKGKTFAITGKAQDASGTWWYRFTFNVKTGYASSKYVTTKTTSNPPSTNPPSGSSGSSITPLSNTTGTVATKSSPLTIRSGPGTSYSKLGTLAKGKTFAVTGKTQDKSGSWWYVLDFNGKKGYASSAYVTIKTSGGSTDPGASNGGTSNTVTFQLGTVITSSSPLNVRSGAGSSYSKLGTLSKGATVTITGSAKDKNGKVWYTYQFSSSKTGYICSDYVKLQTVTSTDEFEAYLTAQGFPESYKPGLRALHAAHPNWVFRSVKLGYNWSDAIAGETKSVSTNLVSKSMPVKYRSTDPRSYNSKTGAWTSFDSGGWYAASSKVISYYMDPRNFLDDEGVYQFMTHRYDSSTQNEDTIAAVIKGTFMQTRNPGGGYSNYRTLLNNVGKEIGINPNVLAAMIVQEQGVNGTSGLISGTYSGYKGYYNFFNVGAYKTSTMSAVQRGLWYAKEQGWNSVYKAIKGGAEFYAKNYVNKNQDSYYTKKFNVKNGLSKVGTHQYMTNVSAAYSEGKLVKRAAVDDAGCSVVFEIPVYNNMPATPCPLP